MTGWPHCEQNFMNRNACRYLGLQKMEYQSINQVRIARYCFDKMKLILPFFGKLQKTGLVMTIKWKKWQKKRIKEKI